MSRVVYLITGPIKYKISVRLDNTGVECYIINIISNISALKCQKDDLQYPECFQQCPNHNAQRKTVIDSMHRGHVCLCSFIPVNDWTLINQLFIPHIKKFSLSSAPICKQYFQILYIYLLSIPILITVGATIWYFVRFSSQQHIIPPE